MQVEFRYAIQSYGHTFIGRNADEAIRLFQEYEDRTHPQICDNPDLCFLSDPIIVTDEPVELEIIPKNSP